MSTPESRAGDRWLYGVAAIAILTLPFMDFEVFQAGGKSIVLPYITAAAVLPLALIRPRAVFAFTVTLPETRSLLLWLGLATWSSYLTFLSTQRGDLLAANERQLLNVVLMLIQFLGFAFVLATLPRPMVGRLVNLAALTALVGALFSFYQLASVYVPLPAADFARNSNLYFKADTLNLTGGGSWAGVPRPTGTAPEPTFWGGFLLVMGAYYLGRVCVRRRGIDWLACGVVALAIFTTFSRAAFVGCAFVALVLVATRGGRYIPRRAAATIVVLACGTSLVPAVFAAWLREFATDLSAVERLSSAATALELTFAFPLFGIGPGSIDAYVDRYMVLLDFYERVAFSRLYSFFHVVLVGTGIIGMIVFLVFLWRTMSRFDGDTPRTRQDPEWQAVRFGAFLSATAALGTWTVSPAYNFTFLWFALGAAAVLGRRFDPESVETGRGEPALARA
ncbi:MAG: O-antigen ligase family protein [Vicinamibacterales bacterium]